MGPPVTTPLFHPDPSRQRAPSSHIQCRETNNHEDDHEELGPLTFHCSLPDKLTLVFSCRDKSCGVMIADEAVAEKNKELSVDPFFFDIGYTLAGKTGFQIWPGTRLLVEALTWPQAVGDCAQLAAYQQKCRNGARVLELGAGIGVVGTALAAIGSQVLLTDLPTLVTNAIRPNLSRNEMIATAEECPSWLKEGDGVRIGRGWAGTTVIDWRIPVETQLSDASRIVDFVVGCDCLWLVDMIDHVLSIVAATFLASPNAKFLFTYQRRAPSSVFTNLESVLAAIQERRWAAECLAWRRVDCEEDDTNDLLLFEASPVW